MLYKPPYGRGMGVSTLGAQYPHILDTRQCRCRRIAKAFRHKQQLPGRKIGLRFHVLVTGGRQRPLGVSQHHSRMPWNDVMPDLMRLVPAMLKLGRSLSQ